MFSKSTLAGFALAPLAATTFLAQTVSATPAALASRSDGGHPPPPPPGPHPCDCDKDHAPQIVKPCKGTVWHVGQRQNVTWYVARLCSSLHSRSLTLGVCVPVCREKKWDDDKPQLPKQGQGKRGDDDKYGHPKPPPPPPCNTTVFLGKGNSEPFGE